MMQTQMAPYESAARQGSKSLALYRLRVPLKPSEVGGSALDC